MFLWAVSRPGSVKRDELRFSALCGRPLCWWLLGHRRLLLGRASRGRHLGDTPAIGPSAPDASFPPSSDFSSILCLGRTVGLREASPAEADPGRSQQCLQLTF